MTRACPLCAGWTGRGDLVIKEANLHDRRRCPHTRVLQQPPRGREQQRAAAQYRDAYAKKTGTTSAFMTCGMFTSCQIHGEFLRLSCILADQRNRWYLANFRDDEPGTDAFTWRRAQFYWQHRAAIGLANAIAVSRRAHLAHPPHRRQWARPPTGDPIPILHPPPRS